MRGSDGRLILASVIILLLLYHIWTGQGLLRSPRGYAFSDSQSTALSETQTEAWRGGGMGSRGQARIKVKVTKHQRSGEPEPVRVTVKLGAAGGAAAQATAEHAALVSADQRMPQQAARHQQHSNPAPGFAGGQGRKHLPGIDLPGHLRVQSVRLQQVQRAEEAPERGGSGGDVRAGSVRPAAVGAWGTAAVQHASQAPPSPPITEVKRPWAGDAPLPPPRQTCESWLAAADRLPGGRDFAQQPVTVLTGTGDETLEGCAVPCRMTTSATNLSLPVGGESVPAYDAHFGVSKRGAAAGLEVVRSMESVTNYPHLDAARAHAAGKDVVMTTHLDSDVPAGYLSWAEYDIMRPPEPKQEQVAAFISNCAADSFRLDALDALTASLDVHSYGRCRNSADTVEPKGNVLRKYHFSLAFENSQEEDYVTEKYAQSLETGSVPIVIGPPNIADYEPAPGSVLAIHSMEDVPQVAARVQHLLQNRTAYEEMLAWKREGPQDSFLALVDLNNVHSTCRLCIHLATGVRAREAAGEAGARRPCRCARRESGEVVHHLLVRERGRFAPDLDVFLGARQLSVAALHAAILAAFRGAGHRPLFLQHRPDFRAGNGSTGAAALHTVDHKALNASSGTQNPGELRLFRVYPVGATQKAALHGDAALNTDAKVAAAVLQGACPQLEVIFV